MSCIPTAYPLAALRCAVGIVRSIRGMENAHIIAPGYAISTTTSIRATLKYSLETKVIGGLFFAGQINGTTGYEEAGAQVACWPAQQRPPCAKGKDAWCPRRRGLYRRTGRRPDHPGPRNYRMFTSRAEYRLILREDNRRPAPDREGSQLGLG